jgi:hypothetical protein
MKQLLILLLVFSAIQVNAQWYTRKFGVTDINELDEAQLNIALINSKTTANVGIIMISIGIAAMIGGAVVYNNGEENYEPPPYLWNDKMMYGGLLIGGGALTTVIGIPLLIVGGNRKYLIKGQLAKFNDTSYIPSIGIIIYF